MATGVTGQPRNAAIAARIRLLRGDIALTAEVMEELENIRSDAYAFAEKMVARLEEAGAYDVGRTIAALDNLQHAYNVAADAILLAHVPKE